MATPREMCIRDRYKSMFDRVKVNFGKTEADVAKLPIPKRLEAYKKLSLIHI